MMKRFLALPAAILLLTGFSFRSPAIHNVTIEAVDYAFRVPATLPAGLTAFRLVNHGTVLHEVQIFRIVGISYDSASKIIGKPPVGRPPFVSMSVLIVGPGHAADQRVLVDGHRGDIYGLICQFQDADNKPHHRDMGMYALIRVK